MPRVSVAATGANVNVNTLLSTGAPITGWATGSVHSDPDNTEPVVVKFGGSGMTSSNYDYELEADESTPLSQNGAPVFLPSLYVRNDGAAAIDIIFNIRNT